MRRLAAAIAALVIAGAVAPSAARATATSSGRWAITARGDDPARVQLRLEYGEYGDGHSDLSVWSSDVPYAEAGIAVERLRGPVAPIAFEIQREPGTFNCTGSAGNGTGAGLFAYAANARFDDALASRGLGRPTYRESLELATSGMTLAFVDQLRGSSPHATVADIVRIVQHGVTPRYVAELAALGYRNLSVDQLMRLADHGVRERYVAELRGAGLAQPLTAEQLMTLRDHGVTGKYVAELAADGYRNLAADELIALRDHGVTAAFIARLKTHGYANVPVRDLIRLRDAGI